MSIEARRAANPANVQPFEFPHIPTDQEGLLIEALRHSNRVHVLLNELAALAGNEAARGRAARLDLIHSMLLRRFSDCSAVHLFIAADNIGVDLPPDLRSEAGDDYE